MMIPSPHCRKPAATAARRGGFSLVELVLAGALMAVLLGSMASVLVVTTRAVPGASSAPSVSAAAAAVTQMADELRTAVAFSQRTGTGVTFTVPDRNADGSPDPVRYQWSGTPGTALVRRGRDGISTTLLPSVHSFSLTYTTATSITGDSAVTSVEIVVQVGPSPATAVRTAVMVMNAPSPG